MKRWVLLLGAVCVATASYAYKAQAGYTTADYVAVGANSYAWGSLGTARNSTDTNEYIGCAVINGSGSPYVYCYAENAAGVYVSCQSTNANYVASGRAVNGDSDIYFTQDGSGICTYLSVNNGSDFAPKHP